MSSPSAFNPSATITFVVKNNSSINRSIKVFNTKINPGGQLDVMDVPGVTEEDIRVAVLKGPLKNLLSGGALQVLASTVNFNTSDPLQSGFLKSIGINPSGASGSALTNNPLTQTSWYVDPTNGSDVNDGTTIGTAIKTVAELSSRWGKGNLLSPTGANTAPGVTITVNMLGHAPTTDPLNIDVVLDGNVRLLFLGGVAVSTPLTVTAVTQRNRATNTPWQFTATGGVTVAQRIFDSTVGAYFWTAKDLTANAWRLSEPCTKPTIGSLIADANQVAIANTDTFVLQTLYTLKLGSIRVMQIRTNSAGPPFGSALFFRDLDLTGDYCPELSTNTSGTVYECKFSKSILPASGTFNNLQNCCQPTGQLIRPLSGSLVRFYAGGYIGGGATGFSPTGSALQFAVDVLWQGTSLSIVGSNRLGLFSAAIFDGVAGGNGGSNLAGHGLMVSSASSVTFFSNNGGGTVGGPNISKALWGSGQAGGGVGVASGSTFAYVGDGYVPSITGSIPGTNDFVLGTATSTYAPVGDGTYVGPTTNSWANLVAARGAGTGFGGNAVNPLNFASILKTD
jgi:hypothetical protein